MGSVFPVCLSFSGPRCGIFLKAHRGNKTNKIFHASVDVRLVLVDFWTESEPSQKTG